MSIGLIVTRGFSNGTLVGTIADVVKDGYSASATPAPTAPESDGLFSSGSTGEGIHCDQSTGNGIMSNQTTGSGLSGNGGL